jgi:pyruvate kinase
MLESMIEAPRPTRAETSDVANAILDGADAVMLSGETAMGQYPIEAVTVMKRIIKRTEERLDQVHQIDWDPHTVAGVISLGAIEVAERMGAKCIAAFTISGDTPHRVARLRSSIPIIAFTPKPKTAQELTLCWGVRSFVTPEYTTTDAMVSSVQEGLTELNMVTRGDRVVIVSGNPGRALYNTTALRLYEMS